MNSIGIALQLNDQTGAISNGGPIKLMHVAIKTALVGNLVIQGFSKVVGSQNVPDSWTINSGSAGLILIGTPDTSGGSHVGYAFSNPADAGNVVVAYRPV
jgi:hypothetical protein